MALGSFTRDVAHLMISIVPVFMFATPIFYSIDDVPPHLRIYLHLNPIGNYVEMIRDLLLFDRMPESLCFMAGRSRASLLIFLFLLSLFHAIQGRVRRCHLISSSIAINVGKAFQLYMRRNDQLKQAIFGHWKQFYHEHWVLRDISFKVRVARGSGSSAATVPAKPRCCRSSAASPADAWQRESRGPGGADPRAWLGVRS